MPAAGIEHLEKSVTDTILKRARSMDINSRIAYSVLEMVLWGHVNNPFDTIKNLVHKTRFYLLAYTCCIYKNYKGISSYFQRQLFDFLYRAY